MKNKKIDDIISEYKKMGVIHVEVEEKYINMMEEKLQVKFSENYKLYYR